MILDPSQWMATKKDPTLLLPHQNFCGLAQIYIIIFYL